MGTLRQSLRDDAQETRRRELGKFKIEWREEFDKMLSEIQYKTELE